MKAHPYADKFPMLPQGELEELAESIRENGLRQPIVVTTDGLILDGRNRAAACALVGIEPETVVYEGDDLAEYVIDSNVTRRNMSTGARAMATALVLEADGKRKDGKWAYGTAQLTTSGQSLNSWRARLQEAGVVLDWTPEAAGAVASGDLPLKVAYKDACEAREKVDAEKRAKAIEANRKREATIREREANDRMLQVLTQEASPYLTKVESGEMSIKAAHAAHMADTEKQREERRQLEMGWRDTNRSITESVRFLNGGKQYAEIYLRDVYPHEATYIPEGMRLTRARIDSAIEFLETIRKGVHR